MWELDHEEGWALKQWCFWSVVLKKSLESPMDSKEIKSVSPKENQPWIFIGRTDAEAEALVLWLSDMKNWYHWKRYECWERLRAKGEGGNRGWDGWMALPTQWTWVWANSGRQWKTGKPGMLRSMGWQRVEYNLVTEQQRLFGDFN